MKVLFVSVFRNASGYDCTAGGLSSLVESGHLFFDCTREDALAYCEEKNMAPDKQFYLVQRELWGEDHSYAEPLVKPEDCVQCFGGNFLYTSDSRMYMTGGQHKVPVPIHDCFETYENYNILST